jgi:ATP-dependent DNA helicase DinG
MDTIFNEHGFLSQVIPSYEFRSEQLHMADFILESMINCENGIIEAGTGTGKTLAYLLPVVLHAVEHDKKVAVSTETKTLQKQLFEKDLPIVKEVVKRFFNMDFSYSLCLGSSNYPCRKRFEFAIKTGKFKPGDIKKLEPLYELFDNKKIITYFDLSLPRYIWNEINREGDSCNSYKCPFSSICSYQLARKEWTQSNVLVMNHYLFFTNIASGKTYLPQCEIAVFDEAHSLEDVAASQLGFNLGYEDITEVINLFRIDRKGNVIRGIENEEIRSKLSDLAGKTGPDISAFFESLRAMVPAEKMYLRIREAQPSGNALVERLQEVMLLLADSEASFDEDHPQRIEFDIARGKLFTYLEELASFVFQKSENYVYWIERESEAVLGDLFLRGQPVDIAELFQREVLACYDSSLFISATLSIGGDFSYIAGRLGIENHRGLSLPSSFDYKNQVVFYVAQDLPDPGKSIYSAEASQKAAEIINHLQGNCLMLFTSYRTMREVKNILSGIISYPIYSQDVLASTDAIDRYVNDTNSVLMGANSFWQGIDLPGDLVRGVIVMKLPFSVPDSPPVEAKMERLQALGKNPFSALQIPEAVIRFKQGFGRLIRSRNDRGIVAVLDSRITGKPYGRLFLKAIPECRIARSLSELKDAYSAIQQADR